MRQSLNTAVLAFLLALPSLAYGHPDLLLQIEDLEKQIVNAPADAQLLMKRGDLYRRHGDFDAAQRDFNEARKLNPELPVLDFYEGHLMLDSGHPAPAEELLSSYLEYDPSQVKALILRAESRLELGRAKSAADDYREAIDRSEKPSPELYRQQALALLAAGHDSWPTALSALMQGLGRYPRDVSLLGLATDIALACDQLPAARKYIDALPVEIQALPRWKTRLDLAAALELAGPEDRTEILRQAREVVQNQAIH